MDSVHTKGGGAIATQQGERKCNIIIPIVLRSFFRRSSPPPSAGHYQKRPVLVIVNHDAQGRPLFECSMQLPKFITSFKSTKKKDESSSESAAEQEAAAAAPPRAVPRSIMLFTCASLAGAFITLIVSLLDLGYLSFWLNPCASIYTLIYHIGFILIGRRKRVPDNPSYFSTCIFSGYLLALIWFAAFIATIVGLAVHSNPWHQVETLRQHGLPATVGSQRVQVVLALYELVVVAGMAVKGHSIVLRDGPDPVDWRYQEHEDQDVEAAVNPPPQMMSVTETVIAEEYVSAYLGD